MSLKMVTRPRKHKLLEEMKQQTVVQVHKTIKSDSSSEEKNNIRNEDQNDNYNITPSREVSVDEESQINSKILCLIESEMKRDANKHSHFTDSRPQSLSFYEDEKMPEELSGNLELLSPEERKHYKKRKEYSQMMGTDEMNAYNAIQDLYNIRDGEEIIASTKKSKSRKKRHGESASGIGDSREMMIPKEKKKNKKKKRESSPVLNGKRKHRKRDEELEPRTEITVALEELQDDVFENNEEVSIKVEKIKKSPSRKTDKVYVQKKNKFEATTLNRQRPYDEEENLGGKKFHTYHPLELAIPFQKYWIRFSTLCHGLLGGLAFGHWLWTMSNINVQDEEFISHYSHFSNTYVSFFYFLCVICLISVLEKVDFAHFETVQLRSLCKIKKSSLLIVLYLACLLVHLSAARIDYKLGLVSYYYNNDTIFNITKSELSEWNHLSLWRSLLAFVAWTIVGLSPQDNMFYLNLKSMEKYLPQK